MPKASEKAIKQPMVTIHLTPGKAATEHEKKLWRAWWQRLFSKCRAEPKAENEVKK